MSGLHWASTFRHWHVDIILLSAILTLYVDNTVKFTFIKPFILADNPSLLDYKFITPKYFVMAVQNNYLFSARTVQFRKYHVIESLESYTVSSSLDYTDMHVILSLQSTPNPNFFVKVFEISVVWGFDLKVEANSPAGVVSLDSTASPVVLTCANTNNVMRTVDNYNEILLLDKCEVQGPSSCPLLNNCLLCIHKVCMQCQPGSAFDASRNCKVCDLTINTYDFILQECLPKSVISSVGLEH